MSLLSFDSEKYLDNLSQNDRRDLLAACSVIYNNQYFGKICDHVYTEEILNTISNCHSVEELAEGRGKMLGIAGVMELIKNYHVQYLDSLKREEQMSKEDEQEII